MLAECKSGKEASVSDTESVSSFDIFSELSAEEIEHQKKRKNDLHSKVLAKLTNSGLDMSVEASSIDKLKLSSYSALHDLASLQRLRYLTQKDQKQPTLKASEPAIYQSLFSEQECDEIVESVFKFVSLNVCDLGVSINQNRKFTKVVHAEEGWLVDRHTSFPTTDLPVSSLPGPTQKLISETIEKLLYPFISQRTGISASFFKPRDLFIVKYSESGQRELGLHSDGCLISFNVLLSSPADFCAGGTFFKSFNKVYHNSKGSALIHDSRLEHSGLAITSGTRLLLVGFLDTI
ncbi:hypothetical protein BB561_003804 [Smittium simulii]|uniref:Prolyl 4-hydroxylase alpha subunit domain-containing protein n=1 Tax=Smittium simulii TaxID=133385 RepID=A0A2T9YJI1_9FUNG|nr:hypothetical protein BB561_003804 [Smittium simulii]